MNGYNLGRDYLIGNITNTTVPSEYLNDTVTYSGYTWSAGYTYQTDVIYVANLLQNTSDNINHNWSVATPTVNASDGLVAVLQVTIHERPPSSAGWRTTPQWLPPLLVLFGTLLFPVAFL